MRKIHKTIYVLLIIFCIFIITCESHATGFWTIAKDWLIVGANGQTEAMGNVANMGSNPKFMKLIDFLWSIGLLTIFISTIILGIKYMFVPPGEKSRVIQATTPYIIGVVIIFGAVTIWKLVIDVLNGSL